jgi:hypothetical protein
MECVGGIGCHLDYSWPNKRDTKHPLFVLKPLSAKLLPGLVYGTRNFGNEVSHFNRITDQCRPMSIWRDEKTYRFWHSNH